MNFVRQIIDDSWIIDGNKSFSESWIGVTRFEVINNNPSEGHIGIQGKPAKKQVLTRLGQFVRKNNQESRKSFCVKPQMKDKSKKKLGPSESTDTWLYSKRWCCSWGNHEQDKKKMKENESSAISYKIIIDHENFKRWIKKLKLQRARRNLIRTATWMILCHRKNSELENKCQGRVWEEIFWRTNLEKYVIVTEQSAPASHLTMVSFERYFEITWLCWMSKWYRERIYSSQNKRDARNSSSYGDCQENWMRIPKSRKRTFRLNYEPVRWSGPGFSKKRKSEKVHLKSDGSKTPEDSAFTSIDNYNSHCFL